MVNGKVIQKSEVTMHVSSSCLHLPSAEIIGVLGIKLRALGTLGKHFTNRATSPTLF